MTTAIQITHDSADKLRLERDFYDQFQIRLDFIQDETDKFWEGTAFRVVETLLSDAQLLSLFESVVETRNIEVVLVHCRPHFDLKPMTIEGNEADFYRINPKTIGLLPYFIRRMLKDYAAA